MGEKHQRQTDKHAQRESKAGEENEIKRTEQQTSKDNIGVNVEYVVDQEMCKVQTKENKNLAKHNVESQEMLEKQCFGLIPSNGTKQLLQSERDVKHAAKNDESGVEARRRHTQKEDIEPGSKKRITKDNPTKLADRENDTSKKSGIKAKEVKKYANDKIKKGLSCVMMNESSEEEGATDGYESSERIIEVRRRKEKKRSPGLGIIGESAKGNTESIRKEVFASAGPSLFSTFCVNVKMQYTLNQRLFLVKQYWITNSITATQRAYQREFGVRNPPRRNTILGLVNKLETTGSLSTTGAVTQKIIKTFVAGDRVHLLNVSESLKPYRVTVVHQLQEPDKDKRLNYCRWFQTFIVQNLAILSITWNLWPPRSPDLTTPDNICYRVQISGSSGNESGSSGLDPSTFEHDYHTMVDQMETQYYTYKNPSEKKFSAVIRNVPYSLSDQEIKVALEELNYPYHKVTRLLGKNKQPTPLCAIELDNNDQDANPKRFLSVQGAKILVMLRTTANSNHAAYDCVNCQQQHPTNYRGCEHYLQLKEKLSRGVQLDKKNGFMFQNLRNHYFNAQKILNINNISTLLKKIGPQLSEIRMKCIKNLNMFDLMLYCKKVETLSIEYCLFSEPTMIFSSRVHNPHFKNVKNLILISNKQDISLNLHLLYYNDLKVFHTRLNVNMNDWFVKNLLISRRVYRQITEFIAEDCPSDYLTMRAVKILRENCKNLKLIGNLATWKGVTSEEIVNLKLEIRRIKSPLVVISQEQYVYSLVEAWIKSVLEDIGAGEPSSEMIEELQRECEIMHTYLDALPNTLLADIVPLSMRKYDLVFRSHAIELNPDVINRNENVFDRIFRTILYPCVTTYNVDILKSHHVRLMAINNVSAVSNITFLALPGDGDSLAWLVERHIHEVPLLREFCYPVHCTNVVIESMSHHCLLLRILKIPHSRIDDLSVSKLETFQHMIFLDVSETKMTRKGYRRLLASTQTLENICWSTSVDKILKKFPDEKRHKMKHFESEMQPVEQISRFFNLVSLKLARYLYEESKIGTVIKTLGARLEHVTMKQITGLKVSDLITHCTRLKEMVLSSASNIAGINDAFVRDILISGGFKNLEKLKVLGCGKLNTQTVNLLLEVSTRLSTIEMLDMDPDELQAFRKKIRHSGLKVTTE
ncbi:hypothetical protein ANN_19725 [Periplaneta americana]|uniref:DUF4817 domain-containing protein n=1 Tax=Periplaneta americana TaxID=6978 RepID=A0ABQ8SBK7_PERAM|nr:hypothetical protein ANN_19725 [Periplaneta americana]